MDQPDHTLEHASLLYNDTRRAGLLRGNYEGCRWFKEEDGSWNRISYHGDYIVTIYQQVLNERAYAHNEAR